MQVLAPGDTIGILGGGQLGRMLAMSAARYGLKTHIFDPATDAPAAEVSALHTCASFTDVPALTAFADNCQVVTFEFENIPKASLEQLAGAIPLRPGLTSLETSQDRLTEKQFLEGIGLQVAPYAAIDRPEALSSAHTALGGDTILKSRRFGYDGKGQTRLKTADIDANAAWQAIGEAPAVLEARIPFVAEVSAVIARGLDGTSVAYDVPVNVHKEGILDTSALGQFARFDVSADLASQAQKSAIAVANALDHIGVLTVEFFVTDLGALLVNEIAPRVHNSGHWTMDACLHDQFDNHIRAVAGWPLGNPIRHSDAIMTNLIGDDVASLAVHAAEPATQIHLYGKTEARKGRKMGHITRIAPRQ
ncbi:MAG: 5-(carboxyamino)imidazole ribonucleotide synthase [Hyphomicrobiales bacterium]|jgi:5-(carboxyamino)imidazole ribonucleotide synthase